MRRKPLLFARNCVGIAARRYGWGARIRTWEWRDQNPLPYHLATPQHYRNLTDRGANAPQHRRHIQAPGHESAPPTRHPRRNALRLSSTPERRENARPRTREPRRSELPKPLQGLSHLGVLRPHHRLAVVPGGGKLARLKSGAYCDDGGISSQLRTLEHIPGRHRHPGWITTYHRSGSSTGTRRSPTPSAQAEEPLTKTGTSAPNGSPRRASSSIDRPQRHK